MEERKIDDIINELDNSKVSHCGGLIPQTPGALKKEEREDLAIESVVFVCTGNLCRSPMAAGILKKLVRGEGLIDIRIDSAGTYGCEGEPAAPLAERVCREEGVDISGHIAKRIDYELASMSDLIVVMEIGHFQEITDSFPGTKEKLLLIGSLEDGKEIGSIADPYGKGLREYRECYSQLKRLVEKLYEDVLKKKASRGME